MSVCPNKSSQEWKDLVAALGSESMSQTVFELNGEEIPNIARAQELVASIQAQQLDEKFNRSADEFKLERVLQQRRTLETLAIRVGISKDQRESIEKLITINDEYQTFLEANIERTKNGQQPIKTTSVSSFIGSTEFISATDYENFKYFGIFMHEVLEELQNVRTATGLRSRQVFNRAFFDERFEKFQKKTPFVIDQLSVDTMFEMAEETVNVLAGPEYDGHVILPEITIIGKNKDGGTIVGRLDMLMIDTRGNAKIYDFKTKKVRDLIKPDSAGIMSVNEQAAKRELATKVFEINNVNGTAIELQGGSRSTYDTWSLQLKLYENLLRQHGLNVTEQKIVGVIYQADKDRKFEGYAVSMFDGNDFYHNAAIASVTNYRGNPINVDQKERKIKGYRDLIDKLIPISAEQVDESNKQVNKGFPFDVTEAKNKELFTKLQQLLDSEIKSIYADIENARKSGSERLMELLKTRRQTLQDFKAAINVNKDLWATSLKMKFAFESIQTDILKMAELSDEAVVNYLADPNSENSNEHIQVARQAYVSLEKLRDSFYVIKQTLDNAVQDPEAKIDENSELVIAAQRLVSVMERVESNHRQLALKSSIKVLMGIGPDTYAKVSEGMKKGYEPVLAGLKKRREDLVNGMPLSWRNKIGKALGWSSKAYQEKAKQGLIGDDAIRANEIEKLDERIATMETVLATAFQYSEESIETYIKAITDPTSKLYIGQSDAWGNSPILGNFRPDQYIASASNSDPALAAIVLLMKDAAALSVQNVQNNEGLIELERALESFKKGKTVQEMNALITEKRTFRYDKDGTRVEKVVASYVVPVSQEYTDIIRNFQLDSKKLAKEVAEAKANVTSAISEDERNQLRVIYNAKTKEQEIQKDQYLQWAIANMSLKFVKEYYEYQSYLPVEIREKTRNLYLEQELLLMNVDKNSEEQLEQEDYERLKQIEIEIKKIRQEATKDNADYQKYLDSIDSLFYRDYDNRAGFDRIYRDKQNEYAENPEMFEKWKRENMIKVPRTKRLEDDKLTWFEERNEIYEGIGRIYGTDAVMKELIDKRSSILRPYTTARRFDPRFITAEDAKAISELDDQIENYKAYRKENGSPIILTPEERDELNILHDRLKELQVSQPNELYKEELDIRTTTLFNKRALMNAAEMKYVEAKKNGDVALADEAASELEHAEKQFEIYEKEYESWYNRNHYINYLSILAGGDPRQNAVFRSFNAEKVPAPDVYDYYMEEIPHPKYSVKKMREEAFNQDYQELPDGTPLPKGMKLVNGVAIIEPGYQNSPNINSKYVALSNNVEAFDVYNKMMKVFFDMQEKTQGKKLGYTMPGYQASKIENYENMGVVEATKKSFDTYVDEHFKKHSQYDYMANTYGDLGQRLRFRFNEQLGADIQTEDGIGALKAWTVEAHYNQAMSEAQPVVENFIDYMELLQKDVQRQADVNKDPEFQKRFQDINNIIEIMKAERDKFLYGNTEDVTNRTVKKVLNNVFAYTSFIRIGFDVANQTKNYISGNLQAFLAAGSSNHYDRNNLRWAKSQMYGMNGFFADYIGDMGKITDASISTMMYRMFNPAQKDFGKYTELTTGSNSRRILNKVTSIQEIGYMLQDAGDTEIAITVWLAVMNNYKYKVIDRVEADGTKVYKKDAEGKDITATAYEAYEKNNKGQLVIRQDVDMSATDEKNLRNVVYSEMRRAQGNYAKSDMTKAERTIWGKMMFYFKKYLVPQMLNRLGYLRPDWEGQQAQIGYMRAMVTAFQYYGPMETAKHLILGGFTPNWIKNNQMNDLYSKKVAHASREFIVGSVLLMLSTMAYGYVKQKRDDDEELDMITGNMIRVLWGVKGETLSLNPIPVYGGADEYIRNFTNFTSLTRDFQNVGKVLSHGLSLAYVKSMGGVEPDEDEDSLLYQMAYAKAVYQRKTGMYEAGDPKLTKDLHDLTGFKNFRDFFDPNYRVNLMRQQQ